MGKNTELEGCGTFALDPSVGGNCAHPRGKTAPGNPSTGVIFMRTRVTSSNDLNRPLLTEVLCACVQKPASSKKLALDSQFSSKFSGAGSLGED